MIGVLDSGAGGLISYRRLRELLPRADLIYLADRSNAPYGTKSEDELVRLTSSAIRDLLSLGADTVLIACCSASTVHHLLPRELQRISYPILEAAANAAVSAGSRIAVIATSRTVSSHAFSRAIGRINSSATVTEIAAQPLVAMIERGAREGRINNECKEYLSGLCREISDLSPNALVLGCTHFSHIEEELSARLPDVRMISPARLGAEAIRNMELSSDIIGRSAKNKFTEGRKFKRKGRTKCQNTEEAASTMPLPRSLQ